MHEVVSQESPYQGLLNLKIFCERKDRGATVFLSRRDYVGKPVHCPACGNPIEVPKLLEDEFHG